LVLLSFEWARGIVFIFGSSCHNGVVSFVKLNSMERVALAVAVVVRVGAVLSLLSSAYADHPMVDAFTYWDQATKLYNGDDPFSSGYYQPP